MLRRYAVGLVLVSLFLAGCGGGTSPVAPGTQAVSPASRFKVPARISAAIPPPPPSTIPAYPSAALRAGLSSAARSTVAAGQRAPSSTAGAPTITGFSPTSGAVGSTVTINGTNFIAPISITFGGNVEAAGSFTATQITVTVPSGAATGPITVAAQGGSVATSENFTVGASPHLAFFTGEAGLENGVYYLAFPDGTAFGYYSYLSDSNYIYHFDLGYEYTSSGTAGQTDIYFYDFTSSHFWYTSQSLYPYIYDFTLNTFVYYFIGTSNPRYFYNFNTDQYFTM